MTMLGRMVTRISNAGTRVVNYQKKKFPIVKKYAVVELAPPSPGEIGRAFTEAAAIIGKAKNGSWKNLTVYEVTLSSIVTLEVILWFFVGEVIGKRSWVGYPVEAENCVYTGTGM